MEAAPAVAAPPSLDLLLKLAGPDMRAVDALIREHMDSPVPVIPALADHAEVAAKIKRKPGVNYTSLWLNDKGFRKALTAH